MCSCRWQTGKLIAFTCPPSPPSSLPPPPPASFHSLPLLHPPVPRPLRPVVYVVILNLLFVFLHGLCASRVNDGLVEKANASGEGSEEGKPYLVALVAVSGFLYLGSLAGIGAMFHYFDGCSENELVISLTLILALVSNARNFFADIAQKYISHLVNLQSGFI